MSNDIEEVANNIPFDEKLINMSEDLYRLATEIGKTLSQPQEAVAWGILSDGTFIDINNDLKSAESILKSLKGLIDNEDDAYADAVNIPLYTSPPNYETLLKENEKLKEERDTALTDGGDLSLELLDENAKLQKENKRLREALENVKCLTDECSYFESEDVSGLRILVNEALKKGE